MSIPSFSTRRWYGPISNPGKTRLLCQLKHLLRRSCCADFLMLPLAGRCNDKYSVTPLSHTALLVFRRAAIVIFCTQRIIAVFNHPYQQEVILLCQYKTHIHNIVHILNKVQFHVCFVRHNQA